ncbi:hypothetical protein BGW37DRAFT_430467 [Umbelopsis sp. PMI_123]|nr:hypothetical protein BGW37DRAFT_430467 [Umbelopsis sp. PMI_123]
MEDEKSLKKPEDKTNESLKTNQITESTTETKPTNANTPVKIRKKPGRKPNPQSPAIRKAQNRAAQRAFRERKERHLRELEVALKQIKDQRDRVIKENNKLKADIDINRAENWYLKGIVLTLQLVCYENNIVIPQHSPYLNEQALSVMAQNMPECISAYLDVNAHNKLPIPSKLVEPIPSPINIPELESKDLGPMFSSLASVDEAGDMDMDEKSCSGTSSNRRSSDASYSSKLPPSPPPFHKSFFDSKVEVGHPTITPPSPPATCRQSPEHLDDHQPPPMSALAAIQAIRLKLRLRLITQNDNVFPPHVQPTILQLSIPHDPRIDLIPTAHMRDRMIIFRDQFDLDDCFNMLITRAVFHGGDPGDASTWELPADFFEKYWYLTINYDLKRTNRWRRLQGMNELSLFDNVMEPFLDTAGGNTATNGQCSENNAEGGAAGYSRSEDPSLFHQQFDSVMMDNDSSYEQSAQTATR